MPSQDYDATLVPADIVADLGLVVGQLYEGQNVSTTATLRVRQAAVAPSADARAIRIEASGTFTIAPDGIDGIWLWTDDRAGCPVIITESP